MSTKYQPLVNDDNIQDRIAAQVDRVAREPRPAEIAGNNSVVVTCQRDSIESSKHSLRFNAGSYPIELSGRIARSEWASILTAFNDQLSKGDILFQRKKRRGGALAVGSVLLAWPTMGASLLCLLCIPVVNSKLFKKWKMEVFAPFQVAVDELNENVLERRGVQFRVRLNSTGNTVGTLALEVAMTQFALAEPSPGDEKQIQAILSSLRSV